MSIQKPTESELEILQLLWQSGPATVKQINEELNKVKETGYTTTLKIMQIMHEKELLTREQAGRQHVYSAAVSAVQTRGSLLNRFIDSTFQGNAMGLVMQALGNHQASSEELDELKELIKQLEQK